MNRSRPATSSLPSLGVIRGPIEPQSPEDKSKTLSARPTDCGGKQHKPVTRLSGGPSNQLGAAWSSLAGPRVSFQQPGLAGPTGMSLGVGVELREVRSEG